MSKPERIVVSGSVGCTVMPASYHICAPPPAELASLPHRATAAVFARCVHVAPASSLRQTPSTFFAAAEAAIAYIVDGWLGATASSMRPMSVVPATPLPVPAGQPLLSSVHAFAAGQPPVGIRSRR